MSSVTNRSTNVKTEADTPHFTQENRGLPKPGSPIAPLPDRCRYADCGSESLVIRAGKPPHAAELRCEACGRHQKWLGKAVCEAIGFDVEAGK